MGYADDRQRPPVLNLITLFSFGLSILNVLWLGFVLLVVLAFGIAGVLLPGAGLPIAVAAGIFALFLLAQSFLSLILFGAAWKTWTGAEGGRSLHRAWAWIILVFDVIDLAFTWGIDGGAWVRLVYAVVVLQVMNRPDVRNYFEGRLGIPGKAPWGGDLS